MPHSFGDSESQQRDTVSDEGTPLSCCIVAGACVPVYKSQQDSILGALPQRHGEIRFLPSCLLSLIEVFAFAWDMDRVQTEADRKDWKLSDLSVRR